MQSLLKTILEFILILEKIIMIYNMDEIPDLAEEKNSTEQIAMCFAAYQDENWKVLFD